MIDGYELRGAVYLEALLLIDSFGKAIWKVNFEKLIFWFGNFDSRIYTIEIIIDMFKYFHKSIHYSIV